MEPSKSTKCPMCGVQFAIAEIAEHPDVDPIGMMVETVGGKPCHLYFFNHVVADCGTTFVVPAEEFLPYIREPLPEHSLLGTQPCEGHCTHLENLQACAQACLYAPYRRYMLAMRDRRAGLAQAPPA